MLKNVHKYADKFLIICMLRAELQIDLEMATLQKALPTSVCM